MADEYPKPYSELVAENATLRAAVSRLETSLGSLQSTMIARDSEIARLRKPRPAPQKLDVNAADKFRRPAYSGR